MKKPETIALHNLYKKLKAGFVYGKNIENVRYPYFHINLSYSQITHYLRWEHFGSSANKCTISDLKWILEVIFKTSAIGFLATYEEKFKPIWN